MYTKQKVNYISMSITMSADIGISKDDKCPQRYSIVADKKYVFTETV